MLELMHDGFLQSVQRYSTNVALEINEKCWTYTELSNYALKVASVIPEEEGTIAILSVRGITSYAGILGALMAGKAYLPLHTKLPKARIAAMLEASDCSTIIVGLECAEHASELKQHLPTTVQFIHEYEMVKAPIAIPKKVNPTNRAYVLFTSGSEGIPKGVEVLHENVAAYIGYMIKKYNFNQNDRFSQAFDTTFDPSILDIFCAWGVGASVCVIPETDLVAPAKFIKEKQLTVWHSVPAIASFMYKMRLLKPAAFPKLRHSFFSAEALRVPLVEAWQSAAPNSQITNLYGPTECTVTVTEFTYTSESKSRCIGDAVPIGWPYTHCDLLVLDENCNQVAEGELYIGGSQVTPGYINNEKKQRQQFVTINGKQYFRTGDKVFSDADGCLHFLGRVDEQIKIAGYRVELGEVDAIIRSVDGVSECTTVAIKDEMGVVIELISFLAGINDIELVVQQCRAKLPPYMVPSEFRVLDTLPRNSNGKIDKRELVKSAHTRA